MRNSEYSANESLASSIKAPSESVAVAALRAIVKITDGSQPIDYPGALMVARYALSEVQS